MPSQLAGPKIANFDRVEWQVIPDPATAAAALQQGEIDWWDQPIVDLLPTLKANKMLNVELLDPIGNVGVLRFNHTQPPFDNPAIRRAVLSAISQKDFMSAIAGEDTNLWRDKVGYFAPGGNMANDAGMEALNGQRDITAAAKAIKDAGYKGEKVVLIAPGDFPVIGQMSEATADLFRKLGFNLDYAVMDWGSMLRRMANRETPDKGGYSAFCTYSAWRDATQSVCAQLHSWQRRQGDLRLGKERKTGAVARCLVCRARCRGAGQHWRRDAEAVLHRRSLRAVGCVLSADGLQEEPDGHAQGPAIVLERAPRLKGIFVCSAITGYADRWSVRQGGDIQFMIAVKGGGRYSARIARVICGDPNPKGPGYREIPVKWDLEGQHDGIEQTIAKGSWVDIPALALPGGPVGFAATIWPTLLAAGQQAVLNWAGVGGSLTLGIGERGAFARLATSAGIVEIETGIALTERAWHDIACLFDPATGVLSIAQAPRKIRLDHDERATKSSGAPRTALAGTGTAAVAAERQGQRVVHHFNGKIERPRITDGGGGLDGLIAAQSSGAAAPSIAEWDFSIGIPTDVATDIGPAKAHGTCINLPTRAMTGSRWTGGVTHRWTEAPKLCGAIHFHDDDHRRFRLAADTLALDGAGRTGRAASMRCHLDNDDARRTTSPFYRPRPRAGRSQARWPSWHRPSPIRSMAAKYGPAAPRSWARSARRHGRRSCRRGPTWLAGIRPLVLQLSTPTAAAS